MDRRADGQRPGRERAVQDLLRAEIDFARAWGAWQLRHDGDARRGVERAERRLDRAQDDAMRRESRARQRR